MKKKILITFILLLVPSLALVLLGWFSVTYRYVSPNDVMRSIGVKRSTVTDIHAVEGIKKSEHSWYEVTYALAISKDVADDIRAKDTPFAPCHEKNCEIGNWEVRKNVPNQSILSGEVRCALRSFEEIHQQRRQDEFCMGEGSSAIYRVYIPKSRDSSS